MNQVLNNILIARTDSIGDVILTLPMCGWIKRYFPNCNISFIGRTYTQAVIESSEHVDAFINWDDVENCARIDQVRLLRDTGAKTIIHVFPNKTLIRAAKLADIPTRIATGRRLQTIFKCNKLVFFSRKNSNLHEAQLNIKLLKPLGIPTVVDLADIPYLYGFTKTHPISLAMKELLKTGKKNIILHPLSKGSGVEWGLENYLSLIEISKNDPFHFFISGTKDDGEKIRSFFPLNATNVTDTTGMFLLRELISFINAADGLVAASTGPLHIAAACSKQAIGLYTSKRPLHPGRWAPLGKYADVLCSVHYPAIGESLDISPVSVRELLLRSINQ